MRSKAFSPGPPLAAGIFQTQLYQVSLSFGTQQPPTPTRAGLECVNPVLACDRVKKSYILGKVLVVEIPSCQSFGEEEPDRLMLCARWID